MNILTFIILAICSYLFGNISNARLISRILKNDIMQHGSKNPGTMNMLRTFGFKAGLTTLLLDSIKGALPALVGYLIFGGKDGGTMANFALYFCGLFVVLGHNFPVFYKFVGGKGVACILGIYAVSSPILVLCVFVVCFIYLLIFDYGAVASFIFITTLTVIEALRFKNSPSILILLCILFFITFFMHRRNITRLLTGKEGKVNLMKSLQRLTKKEKQNKSLNAKQIGEIKKDLKNSSDDKEIG